jgi:hypothetical protein
MTAFPCAGCGRVVVEHVARPLHCHLCNDPQGRRCPLHGPFDEQEADR